MPFCAIVFLHADMAELADAPDLGSGGLPVQVRVLVSADQKGSGSPLPFVYVLPIFIKNVKIKPEP